MGARESVAAGAATTHQHQQQQQSSSTGRRQQHRTCSTAVVAQQGHSGNGNSRSGRSQRTYSLPAVNGDGPSTSAGPSGGGGGGGGGNGDSSDDDDDDEVESASNPLPAFSLLNFARLRGNQPQLPSQQQPAFTLAGGRRHHHHHQLGVPSAARRAHRVLHFDIKCPVCNKIVPSDDAEMHLVICLTRPRITYNEDVLTEDKGECPICFDDMQQGDTIARLPCLCIYHKTCIDLWFSKKNCCPEHPGD